MSKQLNAELLGSLSSEFGNAFYLLDSDVFNSNYIELCSSFEKYYPKFKIAYSYKTNYIPKLARIVDRLGGYAEVVSDLELEIAIQSKVSPSRIIWNGPIKNEMRVKELLLAGGTVNIDSLQEIYTIKKIADGCLNKKINIGIRCNYDVGDGVISRFGFDVNEKDFDAALSVIKSTRNLNLINLQSHFAKRSPMYWTARAEGMLRIYDYIRNAYGLKPERLDLGGGIYGSMPLSLRNQLGIGEVCFDDYASRSAKLFADHFNGSNEIVPWLFIEPGTALAGDCMRFVCRIETIKTVRGKPIATAFGSQKNISMNGINPPMVVVPGGKPQQQYANLDIVGFTCIEGDVLQSNYSGSLAVGDYLVFNNCGSYSIVMKPPFILPNFPVIDISGNNVEIIKRAESFDDLFSTYVFY